MQRFVVTVFTRNALKKLVSLLPDEFVALQGQDGKRFAEGILEELIELHGTPQIMYPRYMIEADIKYRAHLINKFSYRENNQRIDNNKFYIYELALRGINDIEGRYFDNDELNNDKYLGENGKSTSYEDMPKWSRKLEINLLSRSIELINQKLQRPNSMGGMNKPQAILVGSGLMDRCLIRKILSIRENGVKIKSKFI